MYKGKMSKTALRSAARGNHTNPGAQKEERTMSVTGEATVREMPNMARVSVTVMSEHKTSPTAAQRENARRAAAVVEELRDAAAIQILGTEISVQPVYEYQPGSVRRLDHYEAVNAITFETSELDAVGELIDVAARAGEGVQVNGVQYMLDEQTKRDKILDATVLATRNARDTVEELAKLFDAKCIGMRDLVVQRRMAQQPRARGMAMVESAQADSSEPTTPAIGGPIEITVSVALVADIEQCNGSERRDTVLPPFGRAPVTLTPLGPNDW